MRCGPVVFLAFLVLVSYPCGAADRATESILQLVLNHGSLESAIDRLQQNLVKAAPGEVVIEETRFALHVFAADPADPALANTRKKSLQYIPPELGLAKSQYAEGAEHSGTLRILPRIVLGARADSRCTPTLKGRVVLVSTGHPSGVPGQTNQVIETSGLESLSELGSALGGFECYFADVNITVQAEFGIMQNLGNPYGQDGLGSSLLKNPSSPVANIGLGFAF